MSDAMQKQQIESALDTIRSAFAVDDKDRTVMQRKLVLEAFKLVKQEQLMDYDYLLGLTLKVLVEIFRKPANERFELEKQIVKAAHENAEKENVVHKYLKNREIN